MTVNPQNWIQLVGNHEAGCLGSALMPGWGNASLRGKTLRTIASWWREEKAVLAVGLQSESGEEFLVTHAGLTLGLWTELGSPKLAGAVRLINREGEDHSERVFRAGSLVTGTPIASPGVMWSEVNRELYLPWLKRGLMPFNQLHGHASPWRWATGNWWPDTPPEVREACSPDVSTHTETTIVGELPNGTPARMIGIDWGLEADVPEQIWSLLTMDNATIVK